MQIDSENRVDSISRYAAKGILVTVKYRYLITLFRNGDFSPSYAINEDIGKNVVSFIVKSHNQRLNGDGRLIEVNSTELNGDKFIKIRDIVFIDSQLFIKESGRVLRLCQNTGYLQLKISNKEYSYILKKLKKQLYGKD